MRTVRATEANRQFSSVLKQVSQCEEFLIVSRGKPVATLLPVKISGKPRLAARDILLKRLSDQNLSGSRNWTRDELYERKS
ncbi:MAG: hypothetical protein A2511_02530 [Deltaproteobacteria bacterium RIFOXYD12_FULL_50_9]|nr:MAG: hypothetical protein A2511_02530 [Deltaproteobacteria bacterium RIFOXYD12_FULL_50_9]